MIPTDCMTGTNIAKWKFRLAARPGAPASPLTLPPQSFAAFDGRSTGVPPSDCTSLPCPNPLHRSPSDLSRPCRIRAFLGFARPVEPDPGHTILERPGVPQASCGNGSTAAERSPDARPSCGTLPLQLTAIICRSYVTHLKRLIFSPFKLHAFQGAVHIISNTGPSDTARAVE